MTPKQLEDKLKQSTTLPNIQIRLIHPGEEGFKYDEAMVVVTLAFGAQWVGRVEVIKPLDEQNGEVFAKALAKHLEVGLLKLVAEYVNSNRSKVNSR